MKKFKEGNNFGAVVVTAQTAPQVRLPAGSYCKVFLRNVELQGSGMFSNGTPVDYVKGSGNFPNWKFTSGKPITAADNKAPTVNSTVAGNPLIPFETNIEIQLTNKPTTTHVVQDRGGGIESYRLDIYMGIGKSVCASPP